MQIVLDANVLISAVISPKGNAAKILNFWEQGEFELVLSQTIFVEISQVINYPRIKEKYTLPQEYVEKFLGMIKNTIIDVSGEELNIIEADPADNRYLECAVATGANYIVSGDAHLLELGEYQGIVILSPASFLALLISKPGLYR